MSWNKQESSFLMLKRSEYGENMCDVLGLPHRIIVESVIEDTLYESYVGVEVLVHMDSAYSSHRCMGKHGRK